MSQVPLCEICDDVKTLLNKFKMRKKKNKAAIVLKVDSKKRMIVLDEEYEDKSLEEVADELPTFEPRYVVFSDVQNSSDGRVSYPHFFVYCCPPGCNPELQMMYAGSKTGIVSEAKATKVFDVRSTEELTDAFVQDKFKLFH